MLEGPLCSKNRGQYLEFVLYTHQNRKNIILYTTHGRKRTVYDLNTFWLKKLYNLIMFKFLLSSVEHAESALRDSDQTDVEAMQLNYDCLFTDHQIYRSKTVLIKDWNIETLCRAWTTSGAIKISCQSVRQNKVYFLQFMDECCGSGLCRTIC